MKNKRGSALVWLFIALALITITITLIVIFADRIAPVTTPMWMFLTKWGWALLVITGLIVFWRPLNVLFMRIIG